MVKQAIPEFRPPTPLWIRVCVVVGFGLSLLVLQSILAVMGASLSPRMSSGPITSTRPPQSKAPPASPSALPSRSYDTLAAISKEDWVAAWSHTAGLPRQPSRQALTQLAQACGFQLNMPQGHLLTGAIELPARPRSLLEALDETAGLANSWVRTTDFTPILLAGKRPGTVTYAGPFRLVAVVGADDYPTATAVLNIEAQTFKLPESMAAFVDASYPKLEISEIRSSNEVDLYHASRHRRESPQAIVPTFPLPLKYDVPLKNLLADVTRIQSVRGRIVMRRPERVDQVRLELSKLPSKHSLGNAELQADTIGGALKLEMNGAARFLHGRFEYSSPLGRNETVQLLLEPRQPKTFPIFGTPTAFVATLVDISFETYDFSFTDLPLPNRPLKTLQPLAFGKHAAPVELTAINYGRQWKVQNLANKVIAEVAYRAKYRDQTGAERVIEGVFPKPSPMAITERIPPGGSRIFAVQEFVDLWEAVSHEVFRVEFADGYVWEKTAKGADPEEPSKDPK